MAAALSLPPIIEGRHDGDGYWSGAGRYERGDRRDRRLTHWTYGQRVDHARIRRMLAMLDANWLQIDPAGRRGKRFRTSAKILTEIARSLNKVEGISYLTKASIAARLGMHRNTIYKHCKAMEQAGVLIQGHYAMPKGSDFKTYSVFGVPGMTGRLPVLLRFRQRHARHVKIVQITWPLATIARYGQRPIPFPSRPFLVTPANENLFKNVHSTCDYQLSLYQAIDPAPRSAAKRLKGESGATALPRHVDNVAAGRGRNSRSPPISALKRLMMAKWDGHEGRASRFSTSHPDRQLSAVQRVRSVMQAFERDFGHLENYQPIVGFPRGWMRTRVASITDAEWRALVQLVLSRPLLTGATPMLDGRMFQLNFWWLMQEAPRLLGQLAPPKPDHPSQRPDRRSSPPYRPRSKAERDQAIAAIDSPDLRAALTRLAKSMDED